MDDSRKRSKKYSLQGKTVLGFILSCSLLPSVLSAQTPVYFGSPWRGSPFIPPQIPLAGSPSSPEYHEFSLRHIFHRGTHEHPDLHQRLDIDTDTRLLTVSEDGQVVKPATLDSPLVASSNPISIERLADRRLSVIEGYLQNARSTGEVTVLSSSEWVMDSVEGPNVKDKASVRTIAEMTANDYVEEPGTGKWHDINGRFNYSSSFGWQNDGLRGHIYADKTNSTVVISLKGTSPALFDGAGTTTNDKLNDNLFFSCCCGQGGSYLWRQACDCQKSTYNANLTCIIEAMNDENRYYRASMDLYSNVTEIYPGANIWLVGHSLGGAMSSLLGLTFGLPVVSFEAIPDALPASRLGLPFPPNHDPRFPQKRRNTGSYHFGHTADPIYTGTCNGVGATCTWGGYALESACHTGEMCTYDTVKDKGWRVAIGTHRIESVLTDVLDVYDEVPPCVAEEECYDCELWKFFRSNGSETTSTTTVTSTTSPTATRTSTCETPGWWGCLDESTTTTGTTTTSTTTSAATTTTCKTPGWFGCKDPTTTTTTATPAPSLTTTTPTATSTTTSCKDPGWFGCRDPTTTNREFSVTASPTPPPTTTLPSLTSTTCETPGYIWGCYDSSTTTTTTTTNDHPITSAPTSPPPFAPTTGNEDKCTRSVFFGLICWS